MEFRLADQVEYLRADLLERETAGETADFLNIVKQAALSHASQRVLIVVQSPRALFRVERFQASSFLAELAARPAYKVALVARHFEVRLVHQYLEVLARLKDARLRSFAHERAAIRWLTASASPAPAEAASETPR